MFKRMGGEGKGFLNNVQKNCTFLTGWLPLSHFTRVVHKSFAIQGPKIETPVPKKECNTRAQMDRDIFFVFLLAPPGPPCFTCLW